jgi:hypothetical protein
MSDGQQLRVFLLRRLAGFDPLVSLTILFLYGIVLSIIYDIEYAEQRIGTWVCRLFDHRWADDQDYGVEPVCLRCGEQRTFVDR